MIPLTKIPTGRRGILAKIGGEKTVQQRLFRHGLAVGAPISRYATAPFGRGGVWRQGSLLIALRDRDAACLLCQEEERSDE